MPESDPEIHDIVVLIDTVFQEAAFRSIEIPLPDKVAMSLGKNTITLDEYLNELTASGFDVPMLLGKANDNERQFKEHIAIRKAKAAAFFELIQTQWIVDDDDVRKYIDGGSIYEFLELVLEHTESTRARLQAIKRHAADPKQKDKAMVKECWELWQKQPDRYKNKAAFALDMLKSWENLESQRVIANWCSKWEQETKTSLS